MNLAACVVVLAFANVAPLDPAHQNGEGKGAKEDPLAGAVLKLEIDVQEYDPVNGSKGMVRIILKNGAGADIAVPQSYDGIALQLAAGNLSLHTRRPREKKQLAVAPGQERLLFEARLETILMRGEKALMELHWDWPRRSAPPLSPIHLGRNALYAEQATFQAALLVGNKTIASNKVVLKVKAPAK